MKHTRMQSGLLWLFGHLQQKYAQIGRDGNQPPRWGVVLLWL